MKKILLVLFGVVSFNLHAQTFTMPAGAGSASFTTCSGTFVDNGGTGGNYGANQNSTITFCPSTPGDVIKVQFTSFTTEGDVNGCLDVLQYWDGNSATGPADDQICGAAGGAIFVSTDPSGCVTFRFTSDASVQMAGWVATISCVTPCPIPSPRALLTDSSDLIICPIQANMPPGVTALTPGNYNVTLDGTPSNLNGSATTLAQGPVSRYEWNWGDGTTSSTSGSTASHLYPGPGVYVAKLKIRNSNFDIDPNGCLSTVSATRTIRIPQPPNFSGSSATAVSVACNGSTNLTGIAASQTETAQLPPAVSSVTPLPDGTGASYTSSIDYSEYFPENAVMSPGCYPTVTFNIEHSFTGDLLIELVAPNGQSVTLFDRSGDVIPIIGSGFPLATLPFTYHFGACSNGADNQVPGCGQTYTVVNTGGSNWASQNAAIGTQTTTPCGGFAGPCEAGWYYRPLTYNSAQPMSSLDGAPLNGAWTLRITDNLAQDDGTLFSWNLSFPTGCLTERKFITPDIVTTNWSTTSPGPAVPVQSPVTATVVDPGPDPCPVPGTCLGNQITNSVTVGAFTINGSYVYNFTVTDDAGCQYRRPVTITVTGCSVSLPVTLTHFDVIYSNNQANIFWKTDTEINCDRFEVFRSRDGENWEFVGLKKGAGDTQTAQNYHLVDNQFYPGTSYYKLIQFDKNDAQQESEIIVLDVNDMEQNKIIVYPNPNDGEVIIVTESISIKALTLFDMQGKLIDISSRIQKINANECHLNLNGLLNGVYQLRGDGNTIKIVKR